jgi:formiminotetrahydrofolate cyclodeaminase
VSDPGAGPLGSWLDELAAEAPVPAGGHAAAVTAAIAAALVEKVARIVAASPRLPDRLSLAVRARHTAHGLRDEALRAGRDDDAAYGTMMAARRLERAGGPSAAGTVAATLETQLVLLRSASGIAGLARDLLPAASAPLRADLRTALRLARAAAHAALGNARVNAALAPDTTARALAEAEALAMALPDDPD